MVIGELPVGSVVRFGRYFMPHRSDDQIDIDWIKVSKQNDFITQKVLLGMQYDPFEGWNTNDNYELSNIRQFINSEQHSWYHPTHPNDCGPGYISLESYRRVGIHHYSGFLSFFSDEEINAIESNGGDRMRLPTMLEINGGFPYFKRYGKRAHPTWQYGELEYDNYRDGMFSRYYVIGEGHSRVAQLSRTGAFEHISPAAYSGVRPVCKIKGDTEVEQTDKNTYKTIILSDKPVKFFKETQSIDWLLGI